MKINEITNYIYTHLLNDFSKNEFKLYKSLSSFIKITDECKFIFKLIFYKRSNSVSIEVFAWIKHIEVEKIVTKILEEGYREVTIGNEIGRLHYSPDLKKVIHKSLDVIIYRDEDLLTSSELIKKYFLEIVQPFFTEYGNLNAINKIYNDPPFEYSLLTSDLGERLMKGLIIAKLLNRPDYKTLVSLFDEKVAKIKNKNAIENYQTVKNYIEQFPSVCSSL
jgi:hypothetical protein